MIWERVYRIIKGSNTVGYPAEIYYWVWSGQVPDGVSFSRRIHLSVHNHIVRCWLLILSRSYRVGNYSTMLLCLPLMHFRLFTHESMAHCPSPEWTKALVSFGERLGTWEEHHQSRPRKPTGCVPRLVRLFQALGWMGRWN